MSLLSKTAGRTPRRIAAQWGMIAERNKTRNRMTLASSLALRPWARQGMDYSIFSPNVAANYDDFPGENRDRTQQIG